MSVGRGEAEVRDDPANSRYVLTVDGEEAVARYRREGDVVAFVHTAVPPDLEGQGIGSRLIREALADVRRRGQRIVVECAFVAAYLERHPEDADLLA